MVVNFTEVKILLFRSYRKFVHYFKFTKKLKYHKGHTYAQEYSADLSPASFRFESSIDLCNGFVQLAVMMLSNSDLIFLFNYNCSTKVSVQYRTVIGNQFSLTYLKPMAPYNWNVAA